MTGYTYQKSYEYQNGYYIGLVQTICGTRIINVKSTRIARASKERALCDSEDLIKELRGAVS